MYYFTSDNETYLEYMAYRRYQFEYALHHRNLWCPINNVDPDKYGCDCPRKILSCGCTICKNVLQYGNSRLPTYSCIDYFECIQCRKAKCTPNLMWDYDFNRGQQLKRYVVDRYISNVENVMI